MLRVTGGLDQVLTLSAYPAVGDVRQLAPLRSLPAPRLFALDHSVFLCPGLVKSLGGGTFQVASVSGICTDMRSGSFVFEAFRSFPRI